MTPETGWIKENSWGWWWRSGERVCWAQTLPNHSSWLFQQDHNSSVTRWDDFIYHKISEITNLVDFFWWLSMSVALFQLHWTLGGQTPLPVAVLGRSSWETALRKKSSCIFPRHHKARDIDIHVAFLPSGQQ